MLRKDITPGMYVYHRVFLHFGRGEVVGIVLTDPLTRMFERGDYRVRVKFENHDDTTDVPLSAIVRKPDKKRVKWARDKGYTVTFDNHRAAKGEPRP